MAKQEENTKDVDWTVDEETVGPNLDTTVEDKKETNDPDLSKVLERMDALEAENQVLRQQVDTVQTSVDEQDIADQQVESPNQMTLAVIDGEPIIDMRLEKIVTQDNGGNYEMRGYRAFCKVPSKDKEIEITYGNRENPQDFVNLERKKFTLVNIDEADKTGASRVERGVVVENTGKVPEVDRSSGQPVKTGKMVNVVTKRDVRYYTIEVNGEKVELPEDKIYR